MGFSCVSSAAIEYSLEINKFQIDKVSNVTTLNAVELSPLFLSDCIENFLATRSRWCFNHMPLSLTTFPSRNRSLEEQNREKEKKQHETASVEFCIIRSHFLFICFDLKIAFG